MNALTLPQSSTQEQIAAVERGLPSSTLTKIASSLGVPKARLIRGLKLVPRTVTEREKTGRPFSPGDSERLLRLIRARALAREIFTTSAAVSEWLEEPDPSLGNRAPLEMLTTDIGSHRVEMLLRSMIHGVPV